MSKEADFSTESYESPDCAKVFDGIWTISDAHRPALVSAFPECNNRSYIFRLKEPSNGPDFLLVMGVAGPKAVKAVQKLEQETKLSVKFVVSQGAQHHMYLDHWFEGFPAARILIPDRKIPVTRNGKALQEKYPDRWETTGGQTIPALEKYSDQLEFAIFDQVYGVKDEDWTSKCGSEPTQVNPMVWAFKFAMAKRDQLMDNVWTHHKASGLTIMEHNVEVWFTKEQHDEMPFPINQMMGAERFISALPEIFSWIEDPKIHAETWDKVLEWETKILCVYHMAPGVFHK
eukprot:CAMPEP_0113608788 /NCGR_PEP_ID=MMETSP0017_2-20120614/4117_1 /TAXON_ID=2856 /ORGANISM="Cylindrotheca closterium" /LENGTH=287 /DNA_ID=CAMNT_0000517507 /DNA_START=2575 /DNA_END=3435 /DNA_ORIENTATION=+ /assembly_acc=CAM_ASM_000147